MSIDYHDTARKMWTLDPEKYRIGYRVPEDSFWTPVDTPLWYNQLDYKLIDKSTGETFHSFGELTKSLGNPQERTEEDFQKEQQDLKEWDEFNMKVAASNAGAKQVGGSHYISKAIQPWDAMEDWMTTEQFEGFLLGNVVKYTARYQYKDGLKDLEKAAHYLEKLIELVKTQEPME